MYSLHIDAVKGKKILAIGAHSDDLEFLAGGTLLKLGAQNEITIVIATDGRLGTHDFDVDTGELVTMRMTEAKIAAKKIGAKDIIFWQYPDWGLQSRYSHLQKRLIKLFLKYRPDIVFSFDPWGQYEMYVHPDHRSLAMNVVESVMLSTLPQKILKLGLGRRALHVKPKIWLYSPSQANIYVDVTDIWEDRLNLVKGFVSQFDTEASWERAADDLVSVARDAGAMIGVTYAERFRILEDDASYRDMSVGMRG